MWMSKKEIAHRYYVKNKQKILKQQKKYYNDNKEYIINRNLKYYHDTNYLETRRSNYKNIVRHYNQKWEQFHKEHKQYYNKTGNLIRKLWIRPKVCPICWSNKRIISHHPDYNKWYEIIFCCDKCHRNIHTWHLECPPIINLLDI